MLTLRGALRTAPDTSRPRPPGRLPATPVAALLSALLAMGAYCLGTAAQGTYPFGARSRAVNDLGNQFVPLHAHLWDLMRGRSTGDLFFNWNSGYGVPFLADFLTYLSDPLSWLVVLFPRDAVQLPVFLVTVGCIGLGAALMTVFLGLLRPGSPWLRALLAVGFAVSAWTVSDGAADPMWMWVLVSLPVLGIVGDWWLRGRRRVLGALLVAVCVAGDFYTAAMALAGMGLVLLVRLLLDGRPAAARVRVLLQAAALTAVGVALAAPVLTVTYLASRDSQQPQAPVYDGPPDPLTYLAHLLPGGPYPSAPRIGVGVLPLLLVLTFPFVRRVPVRERAAWLTLLLVVALSYIWRPTILLWHGLALPNGSPYRAAVAMTALLVSVAWLALASRPSVRELLAGGGLLAVLLAAVSGDSYLSPGDWIAVVACAGAALWLLTALRRGGGRRARGALLAALACTVFAATSYAVYSVTARRDQHTWWQPKRTIDAASRAAGSAVNAREDWPASRTESGPHAFADNDPLLLGGEGGAYYSSYVPARTARTLQALGAGWFMQGRHVLSFADPVGRALMGVSSYLTAAPGTATGFAQYGAAAPPVVTVRPRGAPAPAGRAASVFAHQEQVLGATVYTVPALVPAAGPRPATAPDGGWQLPGPAGRKTVRASFTAACPPGDEVTVYAPWFSGTIRANGAGYRRSGVFPTTDNGILPAGTVPAGGRVLLTLTGAAGQSVPRFPVGCVDRRALARAVTALRAGGPLSVTAGGHSLAARLRPGTAGTAVFAVPAVKGWSCARDGAAARAPDSFGGLMAVPLGDGASRVACSYRTPGLRAGLAASAAALVVLAAIGVGGLVRNRSSRRSPGDMPC